VACAVIQQAVSEGLATLPVPDDVPAFVERSMWRPEFLPIRRR
jgi:hypothetical protein